MSCAIAPRSTADSRLNTSKPCASQEMVTCRYRNLLSRKGLAGTGRDRLGYRTVRALQTFSGEIFDMDAETGIAHWDTRVHAQISHV